MPRSAALLFVALYGAIVTVRLAYHGLTFSHVGTRGVDIPQLHDQETDNTEVSVSDIVATLRGHEMGVASMEQRLRRLEHAHDLLLNRTKEDT
jgi:hypothetical protein